jgi:hypothetical protein
MHHMFRAQMSRGVRRRFDRSKCSKAPNTTRFNIEFYAYYRSTCPGVCDILISEIVETCGNGSILNYIRNVSVKNTQIRNLSKLFGCEHLVSYLKLVPGDGRGFGVYPTQHAGNDWYAKATP